MSVDYTKFTQDGKPAKGKKKGKDVTETDKRWWLVDLKDRAPAVVRVVQKLIQADTGRREQNQISAKLYGNVELVGVNSLVKAGNASMANGRERSYFNVVQSGIDTLGSKQAKNKPKPLFLTSGGDWKTQRKAKKLDKFVDGILYENDFNKIRNDVRRDAYIFGDGLVQVFQNHGRVRFEKVLAEELFVDWLEALSGKPLQLHRVRNMDRDVLADLFKDEKDKVEMIAQAQSATTGLAGAFQNVADQLTVIESWRLPSGPKAKDGCHTINLVNAGTDSDVSGENLLDEKYTRDYFPFAQRRWCKRLKGHWSQGIPEQVQGQQLELNRMSWVEQRAYKLAGGFKVWLKTGSKIPKEHINNEIGTVIVGEEAPQYLVTPPLPPGFEQKRIQIKQEVFEQIGISQLSANSQKPAGLDSGRALREMSNIETDRFMSDGQDEENFVLTLSRMIIDSAKDIAEGNSGSYQVRVPGRKFIESIDWKDIALDDDDFVMKIFPVSSLPQDPAGRLETVQNYIQAGMIDPVTGKRLLDFPDLEQHETLANAMEDWINMVLEKIVDDGKYEAPDPMMKLDLAEWFALMYYAQGQCNSLDEERLDMLRTWIDQLRALKAEVQAALAPPPGVGPPGQGAPQAAPMAPPQSDMIPNVPGGGSALGAPAPAGAMA